MATTSFKIATQGTLDEVHRRLVLTAKGEHAKVMRTAPQPRKFTRFVDGKRGLREEAVKPNGVITYIYPRLDEVVRQAMDMLYDLSPVKSGRYRRGHTIFQNGRAVTNLEQYESGDAILIGNFEPYARKIELGAMSMRVKGTDQVYWRAARKLRALFKGVAEIRMTYRGIVSGFAVKGRGGNKAELRYPVLMIGEL